jgi:hypothetical protein
MHEVLVSTEGKGSSLQPANQQFSPQCRLPAISQRHILAQLILNFLPQSVLTKLSGSLLNMAIPKQISPTFTDTPYSVTIPVLSLLSRR